MFTLFRSPVFLHTTVFAVFFATLLSFEKKKGEAKENYMLASGLLKETHKNLDVLSEDEIDRIME